MFFLMKEQWLCVCTCFKNFSKIDSTLEEVKIYDEDPQYFVAEYKQ